MSTQFSQDQLALIEGYADYTEDELFSLVGNLLTESSSTVAQEYVMGLPDVVERGRKMVLDAGHKVAQEVCSKNKAASAAGKRLEPAEWAGVLLDAGLAHFTAGIPVISIAIALGKLCNFSVGKLCIRFVFKSGEI